MSVTETPETPETPEAEHVEHVAEEEHDEHGPSDRSYVMIALFLAVLTAIEVALFIFEDNIAEGLGVGSVQIALILLMIIKFWIVGAYFMHLKYENPILTKLFVSGLVLAIFVYLVMLSAFEFNFWNDGLLDQGLPGGLS